MKRFLVSCFLFLSLSQLAPASLEGPIISYFPYADKIYLVRVIEVKQDVVTFSVTQTLRGKAMPTLTLKAEFPLLFVIGSEWAILSSEPWRKTGYRDDVVGDFFKGDCGWIFAKVVQTKDEKDRYAFTVAELKTALEQNPQKPELK